MGSGSNNSSRIKKGKTKQKLVFAKNKNQAILALVVAFAFIVNTIYTIVKYVKEQNPQPVVAQNEQIPNAEENTLEEQPEQTQPEVSPEQNQNNIVDATQNSTIAQDANDIYSQTVNLQKPMPNQNSKSLQNNEGDIEIIPKKTGEKKNGKLVLITVSNSDRSDPFVPTNENIFNASYSLLPPPTNLPTSSDAGKVLTTTISGILYDKYSPSAIINIEGADYLVKKGDVINNYKILSISKSQVIVQLGKNVYQAGVGELLSPTDLNFNTIANLNKKFGGNDVSINVRKKGY